MIQLLFILAGFFFYCWQRLLVFFGLRSRLFLKVKRRPARRFAKLSTWIQKQQMRAMCIVSSRMAATYLINRFENVRRLPLRARDIEFLSTSVERQVRFERESVTFYEWTGDGPTVLFAHGWEGHFCQFEKLVTELRRRGARVVGVDFIGHGKSSGNATSFVGMAEVIKNVAESVGGVDVIVAHSSGCLASFLAVKGGTQVNALVQIGIPEPVDAMLKKFSEVFSVPQKVNSHAALVFERRHKVTPHQIGYSLAKNLPCKLLICHDRLDYNVPFETALRYAEMNPESKFIETLGYGHVGMLKHVDLVSAIVDFVYSCRAASAL